jgi:tetratricopeptide (TPR) repeat protein
MIFQEIVSGHAPYHEVVKDVAVIKPITEGRVPLQSPNISITEDIWGICQQCWNIMPERRPSMRDVHAKIAYLVASDLAKEVIVTGVPPQSKHSTHQNDPDIYSNDPTSQVLAFTSDGLSEPPPPYVSTRVEDSDHRKNWKWAVSSHQHTPETGTEPYPERSSSVHILARAPSTPSQQPGQCESLEVAVSLDPRAPDMRLAPHLDRPGTALYNFATTLSTEFRWTDQGEGFEAKIELERHLDRLTALSNLSTMLSTEFQRTDQDEDLKARVGLERHLDRPTALNNSATTLSTEFQRTDQDEDLAKVEWERDSHMLLPASHPDRSAAIDDLAFALMARFKRSGHHKDMEAAITLYQEALDLRPALHPARFNCLNNLANTLWIRYKWSGQHGDLETSISLYREALDLRPAPHLGGSSSLNTFADALWTRFQRLDQLDDLEAAISLHREILDLRPVPHPKRSSSLISLASALRARFGRSGLSQDEDLDETISLYREALKLLPASHPDRAASIDNLAAALTTRFERTLEAIISLYQEALNVRAAPDPGRAASLHNLANTLSTQFKQTCQREGLETDNSLFQQELELFSLPG